MHRFYVSDCSESDKSVKITGEDVNHILNVLRLGVNDEITVSDGSSRDFLCRITECNPQYILANIIDIYDNNSELPADIYLFQGVPKGDKLETIIQKCVELGVHGVIPVMMERTIVKLDDKKQSKKIARYNLISEAAAKQSRRGIIPKVYDYKSMKEAISFADSEMDYILFPYEFAEGMDESRKIINDLVDDILIFLKENNDNINETDSLQKDKKKIGIFIGPEGGFADSEAKELQQIGAKTMSLGHRILRTETAGMTVMSILSFMLDI
ncbi:16S rRNA (uracil1498-N3)-methyltransferase [Lachnospiraceae bacterium NE2001]|nr:16S rRNA (uracil1498-N3)-methyltransferase [Lachnospiraceae bacterium NE2001]